MQRSHLSEALKLSVELDELDSLLRCWSEGKARWNLQVRTPDFDGWWSAGTGELAKETAQALLGERRVALVQKLNTLSVTCP